MGIENRNESAERPEQVEQFREQDSHKGEECKKELGSLSDFKDDNADKTEYSKSLEDKEKKDEAERVEDMSDPEKSSDKSKDAVWDEKGTEMPVEGNDVTNREVETATIDESNISEKIEASTLENSEQSSKDLPLENNMEACESDSKNVVDNDCANTNQMSPEALNTGKENTSDVDSSNLENNAKNSKDVDGIDSKTDEASTEKSNPERTPRWYDSLPEGQRETHRELENIARKYAGKEPLSKDDKEKLSNDQYKYLKGRNPEDRDDCRVYEKDAIKYVDDNGCVHVNWLDGSDGSKEGTQHSEVIKEGTLLDRYGSNNGSYLSPMNEKGEPYSIKERATGDRLIESNIQDNAPYHKYIVNQDLSEKMIIRKQHQVSYCKSCAQTRVGTTPLPPSVYQIVSLQSASY